jgi:2-oxopent-4-enoate/cis-2-oxohex-4-enoate hydratase
MGSLGVTLEEGDIILSGSLVPLEPVRSGDTMRLEVDGIGTARVQFG